MQTSVSTIKVVNAPMADTTTVMPGSNGLNFTTFGLPACGVGSVAFYGANGAHSGIYYQPIMLVAGQVKAESLTKVCDINTDLPTIGKPSLIDEHPVIDRGLLYFKASNGTTQGIYEFSMGTLQVSELYTCPASEVLGKLSTSQGAVTFEKQNAANDSDNGIWLINKNNLAKCIIKAGPQSPVQINGRPMDANNYLLKTGRPYLEGDDLVFVGTLKNNPTGDTEQALIRYNIAFGGLLSVLKRGDALPSGNVVAGHNSFNSPLSYRDGVVAFNIEYGSDDASSTKYMMVTVDKGNEVSEITYNDAINPVAGVSIYTSSFERPPMTAKGDVCFVSGVELTDATPSVNLFGNIGGNLASYITGNNYPYKGKQCLENISHRGDAFVGNMIAARCFWNDGDSGNEDNLGVYVFYLSEEV